MERVAAIYCRVSTKGQAGDDKISLQDQKTECLARAKADGFTVPADLAFEDAGVSGTKDEDERPAFGAMLAAARKGQFSRVYFLKVDRLGRDDAVIAGALKQLARLKIEYHSLREPGLNSPLIRNLMIGMAEQEHELIVSRTSKAREAKRAQGKYISGQCPYGHRRGKDQTLELDPDEVAVLRRVYTESIHGRGRVSIARLLNAEKVIPPVVYVRVPGVKRIVRLRTNEIGGWVGLEEYLREKSAALAQAPEWTGNTVVGLLGKSINYGELSGRPVIVHPSPAISRATWDRAMAAMKGRLSVEHAETGPKPRRPAMLIGLLKCGCCKSAFTRHVGGRNRNVHSYICQRKRRGTGCACPNLNLEAANAEVIQQVVPYLTGKLGKGYFKGFLMLAGGRKIDELQKALSAAQGALSELESERKALVSTVVELKRLGVGDEGLEDAAARLNEIVPLITAQRGEIDTLMAELSRSRADLAADEKEADNAAQHAVEALWLIEGEDDDPTSAVPPREILREIVRVIEVQPDGKLKVDLDESDDALVRVIRRLSAAALSAVRKLDAEAELRKPVQIDGLEVELGRMLR